MSFHSVVQAEAGMEKRKRKKEKKKKEAIMNVEGDWRGKMDFEEVGDDGYTGVHCILSLVFWMFEDLIIKIFKKTIYSKKIFYFSSKIYTW